MRRDITELSAELTMLLMFRDTGLELPRVEDAINQHPKVIESAVVGYPHNIKGSGIYAYVICEDLTSAEMKNIEDEIREVVNKFIGPIAKPDKIQIVSGLPKTRSGKIMRRILRKIGEGDATNLGDTSTLLDRVFSTK